MATRKPQHSLHVHSQNFGEQRQRIMCKLRDAILTRLVASEPSKPINSEHLKSLMERRLRELIPSIDTPTHPPYASMIQTAIQELNEEGGPSEVAISEFTKGEYEDLPLAHEGLLRHHLRKLCESGVVVALDGGRYCLLVENGDDRGCGGERVQGRWRGEERMEERKKGEEGQNEVMGGLTEEKQELFEVIEKQCEAERQQMEASEEQFEALRENMELDVEGSLKEILAFINEDYYQEEENNNKMTKEHIEAGVCENELIKEHNHIEEQQSAGIYKQNEARAQQIEVIENQYQLQAVQIRDAGELRVPGKIIEVRTEILELCCNGVGGGENMRTQLDASPDVVVEEKKKEVLELVEQRQQQNITCEEDCLLEQHQQQPEVYGQRDETKLNPETMFASQPTTSTCIGLHCDSQQLELEQQLELPILQSSPTFKPAREKELTLPQQQQQRQGQLPSLSQGPSKPESAVAAVVAASLRSQHQLEQHQQSQHQGQQKRSRGRPRKPRKDMNVSTWALLPFSPEHHHEEQAEQPPKRQGMHPKPKKDIDVSTRALCDQKSTREVKKTSLVVRPRSDIQHQYKQQQKPLGHGRGRSSKPKPGREKPCHPLHLQQQPQYRGRGRRPKPKSDAESLEEVPQTPQIEQLQLKRGDRGRGRPPKSQ